MRINVWNSVFIMDLSGHHHQMRNFAPLHSNVNDSVLLYESRERDRERDREKKVNHSKQYGTHINFSIFHTLALLDCPVGACVRAWVYLPWQMNQMRSAKQKCIYKNWNNFTHHLWVKQQQQRKLMAKNNKLKCEMCQISADFWNICTAARGIIYRVNKVRIRIVSGPFLFFVSQP